MLTLTFMPAGTSTGGLVLCNTSRSITELGVEVNHERVISIEHLATVLGGGAAALAQDFANQRNTISLRVRRGVDFTSPTPVAFADPEAAFLFALDQPAQFPGLGVLKIDVAGVTTTGTRYLLNTAVQRIQNKFEDLGIAPAFTYTFNGGLITDTSPF